MIEQYALFDYGSLDTDTRTFVQEKAQAIHARLKRTAEDVIAIGLDLIEVKFRLQHGQFQDWLQSEFDMGYHTAVNFMRVAERFGNKNRNFLDFPVSVLYALASPSTPDTVIEMVESGRIPPTIPAIREAKRERQEGAQESIPATQFVREVMPELVYEPDEFSQDFPPDPLPEEEPANVLPEPVKSATLTALQSSETNEWYTPAQYVEAARELMGGIDVDPASNELANEVIRATRYYTKKDNGLFQPWPGRIWLNPPYGFDNGTSNQEVWTRQLIDRYTAGFVTEAVLLVNANTEAKWFQPLYNYLICFTNHRIRFYNDSGDSSQPTQGNALIYFGKQGHRFIELFSRFGAVVRRA